MRNTQPIVSDLPTALVAVVEAVFVMVLVGLILVSS